MHLAGDRLLNNDGSKAEVVSSGVLAEPLRAYNLTVEGWHTYFVAANVDAAPVWVHNSCFDVKKIRAERSYFGSKKHGINWSDQDAIARAIKNNTPQGRFGSIAEIRYVEDQIRRLGTTGRVKSGIKEPIELPIGNTSKVFYPDGTSKLATHVWVRVNEVSGTIHMYPIVQ